MNQEGSPLANCPAVFLSYFFIVDLFSNTNTKIKMSKTSRLTRAINQFTQPLGKKGNCDFCLCLSVCHPAHLDIDSPDHPDYPDPEHLSGTTSCKKVGWKHSIDNLQKKYIHKYSLQKNNCPELSFQKNGCNHNFKEI